MRRQSPDAVASLIFTSGTTGKPKGVMLTHRNFTFMVSELSKIFEFGVNDGMLSVLPLHHTFEFATGLLVPLAHGAQITYLPELTGDAIASALKRGHITAIVGVPALWDLLRRRLFQRFDDKSPMLGGFMRVLASANYELRIAHRASTSGCCCSSPCTRGSAGASATSSAAARRCRRRCCRRSRAWASASSRATA